MNVLELIRQGSKKLASKNILSHKLDSEILLSKILEKNREQIILNQNIKLNVSQINKFKKFIHRRSRYEPVAYILQQKEFWSLLFYINKFTLIPRPETELMIYELVKLFRNKKIHILDIGTGSGCILISLLTELKNSYGEGVDISQKALKIAKINAKIHNVNFKTKFYKKSFSDYFNTKFDLIVSNPPYIKSGEIKNLDYDVKNFEPKIALDGGKDGLDLVKKVIYKAKYILKLNGKLAIEIGNKQHLKVSEILKKNNFKIIKTIKDFKDNVRCFISQKIK